MANYDWINVLSNQKEEKETEKEFYVHQFKGMCHKCGTYVHNSRDCTKVKVKIYCIYWNKYRHIIEYFPKKEVQSIIHALS